MITAEVAFKRSNCIGDAARIRPSGEFIGHQMVITIACDRGENQAYLAVNNASKAFLESIGYTVHGQTSDDECSRCLVSWG